MTLRPSSDFGIRGHPGKPYDVNELCAVPGCDQRTVHCHHMWRRSELRGQPYEWVSLPDGTVIGNRLGLCLTHHDDVTENRTWIKFELGIFWWEERHRTEKWIEENRERDGIAVWQLVGQLDPQPPASGQLIAPRSSSNGDVCPTCGKTKQTKLATPKVARKTREWTLVVPDDAELGVDVLDGWADDIAVILGFDDVSSRLRRYHAVVTALAWVAQNRDDFVRDLVAAR